MDSLQSTIDSLQTLYSLLWTLYSLSTVYYGLSTDSLQPPMDSLQPPMDFLQPPMDWLQLSMAIYAITLQQCCCSAVQNIEVSTGTTALQALLQHCSSTAAVLLQHSRVC
jgi:hypothetical protein